MALDGSLYDSFTGERVNRLFRPATLEHVLASYPLFVLRLRANALEVSRAKPVEAPSIVRARTRGSPFESWTMLGSDYDKCLAVARKVSTTLFPTQSQDVVLDRIRAYLLVEFSPQGG